jgi:hypothetical protein
MRSLVVASNSSKRTFGTAFTNQHAAFQNDQRRNQRRSNGNDENISNFNFAEDDFKINSTTIAKGKDLRDIIDNYIRSGDTRNFPIR